MAGRTTKFLLALMAMVTTFSASADKVNATKFKCTVQETYWPNEDKKDVRSASVTFALAGLNSKNLKDVGYVYLSQENAENSVPVIVTPVEGSSLYNLNENASVRIKYPSKQVPDPVTKKKRWVLDKTKGPSGVELVGDSDGVDLVYLLLYRDKQYKAGNVRFKGSEPKYNWYTDHVHCTTEEIELEDF